MSNSERTNNPSPSQKQKRQKSKKRKKQKKNTTKIKMRVPYLLLIGKYLEGISVRAPTCKFEKDRQQQLERDN
ncbi:hypothetical protein GCM10023238_10650 [Streptomyces heliomycini]